MDPSAARTVELLGLGRCDLLAAGRDTAAVLAQPKRFGLLSYLVLAGPGRMHQRDKLLALFWPDLPEDKARHSLTQSLYFLRKSLGSDVVATNGGSLVGVGPHVTSDVERFEGLLARDEVEEALLVYGGELLPGLHVTGCRDFEIWLEGERRRLRGAARRAALDLSEQCRIEGRLANALRWARWAAEQSPFDEAAVSQLLSLLGESRDASGLHRAFEAYSSRIRQDLGIEPSAAVIEAFENASLQVAERTSVFSEPSVRTPGEVDNPLRDPARLERRTRSRLTVAVVVAGLLGIGAYLGLRPEMSATDRRVVAVLPFDSEDDGSELANVARLAADWVAREVARSGIVDVIAPAAASVRPEDPVSGDSGSLPEGHAALQAGLVVSGMVYREGNEISIDAIVTEAPSGRVVANIPGVNGAERDPIDVVQEIGKRVAAALATSVDSRFGRWAEVASRAPSLEAYQAFLDGLEALTLQERDRADERFLSAAEMDPGFTAPLIWAVRNRVYMHRQADADSLAQTLLVRRDDLAPWDRAMLDYYNAYLRGTWEQAYQAARRVEFLAPDPEWTHLVASSAQAANRPTQALLALERLDEQGSWMSARPFAWRSWAFVYHDLGRYEDELAIAAAYVGDHPGAAGMAQLSALAGLGRLQEFRSSLASTFELADSPQFRLRLLMFGVDELRAHGHESLARELADRSVAIVDSLIASGDSSEQTRQTLGRHLYLAERWEEAYGILSSFEGELNDPFLTALGAAAARVGREEEAREIARGLLRDNPLDKGHGTYLAARVTAALGDRAGATRLMRQAFEQGFGSYPWLHVVPEWENLRGYEPFEALMKPRG